MTDPDKRNSLLAANINAVVTEECRTNSRLGEVGRLTGGRYLCRPVFLRQLAVFPAPSLVPAGGGGVRARRRLQGQEEEGGDLG